MFGLGLSPAAARRGRHLSMVLARGAIVLSLCSGLARAQSVQATLGTLDDVPSETERVATEIHRRIEALTEALASGQRSDVECLRLQKAIEAGERALRARSNPPEFRARIEAFNRSLNPGGVALLTDDVNVNVLPPQGLTVADVSFAFGLEYGEGITDVALGTNLLGAAGGAAFDAVGAGGLKEYATKNVTFGATFPSSGRAKLTSEVGVGLGGFTFPKRMDPGIMLPGWLRGWSIWPVLAMRQFNANDSRVPGELRIRHPSEELWSAPAFEVGIIPMKAETFQQRIKSKVMAPIFTVSVSLSQYFPGDSFTSTAAIFSVKHSRFERAGGPRWSCGVWIPLPFVRAASSGS